MTDDTLLVEAKQTDASTAGESPSERMARLYASPGGPLMVWLVVECEKRREDNMALARHLGVTYGYINQLLSDIRRPEHMRQEMTAACARYLGVPPIVIKLVAGRIPMADFVQLPRGEVTSVGRAVDRMLDDPAIRQRLP